MVRWFLVFPLDALLMRARTHVHTQTTDGQGVVLRSQGDLERPRQGPLGPQLIPFSQTNHHKQRYWIGQLVCFIIEKPDWLIFPNKLVLFKYTGLRDVSQKRQNKHHTLLWARQPSNCTVVQSIWILNKSLIQHKVTSIQTNSDFQTSRQKEQVCAIHYLQNQVCKQSFVARDNLHIVHVNSALLTQYTNGCVSMNIKCNLVLHCKNHFELFAIYTPTN